VTAIASHPRVVFKEPSELLGREKPILDKHIVSMECFSEVLSADIQKGGASGFPDVNVKIDLTHTIT
jgi:hypothetical protein